ncbi:MAG: hypothetical protein V4719_00330, partial [Planctomycetota bacterium]
LSQGHPEIRLATSRDAFVISTPPAGAVAIVRSLIDVSLLDSAIADSQEPLDPNAGLQLPDGGEAGGFNGHDSLMKCLFAAKQIRIPVKQYSISLPLSDQSPHVLLGKVIQRLASENEALRVCGGRDRFIVIPPAESLQGVMAAIVDGLATAESSIVPLNASAGVVVELSSNDPLSLPGISGAKLVPDAAKSETVVLSDSEGFGDNEGGGGGFEGGGGGFEGGGGGGGGGGFVGNMPLPPKAIPSSKYSASDHRNFPKGRSSLGVQSQAGQMDDD